MNDTTSGQPEPAGDLAALLEEALALHDQGQLEPAESLFRAILARAPRHFVALHQLGVIHSQRGDHQAAADAFATALLVNPRSARAHLNLGIALANLQRSDQALAHYQQSLLLDPGNPQTHLNLGIALRGLGRLEEALACFDQALALQPDSIKALLNRSSVLDELQRAEEALLGYDRALLLQPRDAHALSCRGAALLVLHRPAEALESLDRAVALQPDLADAHLNRGVALLDLDRPGEALASLDQALAFGPDQADAHMNRGNALRHLRKLNEALATYDRSLALQPDHPDALLNRGMALHLLGRHPEAIADCDRALALQPGRSAAHSARIIMLDFLPDLTFERHQKARSDYYQAHGAHLRAEFRPFPNDRDPDRRLVLGYVSADFKRHSAAACFGPVLRHHDPSAFQVVCYSGVVGEDDLTEEFKHHADRWIPAAGLADDQLAERIRQDRVDILVDLSGHSTGNRLPVFARKPAPIQVTAWGHGGGTGIPAIDYQFTDPIHIPAWARHLFAETAVDLPCCLTFEPPPSAPPVAGLPALRNGFVTFGCLNRFSKVTPALLALWARILAEVPASRLLLKDGVLDEPERQRQVLGVFQDCGIGAERIELRGFSSHREHLAAYHEVDLALDSFPQNGGITTWEALWMGVPVVTTLGDHPANRLSAAILGALHLDGWVARDAEGYRNLAVAQAGRLDDLLQFRLGSRQRIAQSPAGSAERYTGAVEAAYRAMWKEWVRR